MNTTADDVLQFVRENDVKFIRLAFCDPFGTQKNMAILPDELRMRSGTACPLTHPRSKAFGPPRGPICSYFPIRPL